jgi:hypothetical protein
MGLIRRSVPWVRAHFDDDVRWRTHIDFRHFVVTKKMARVHVTLFITDQLPVEKQPDAQDFVVPVPSRAGDWSRINPRDATAPCAGIMGLGYGQLPNYRSMRVGLNRARLGPNNAMLVPVMLHYQPTFIRFTGLKEDGTVAWVTTLKYAIEPAAFPRAAFPSTFKRVNSAGLPIPEGSREWAKQLLADSANSMVTCTKTIDEIVQERFTVDRKEERLVGFARYDENVGMAIGVTRVVQDGEKGEPLSFYIDRVWALTSLVLFLSDSHLTDLYA